MQDLGSLTELSDTKPAATRPHAVALIVWRGEKGVILWGVSSSFQAPPRWLFDNMVFAGEGLATQCIITVKPPNKGHFGDGPVVPCREVVLFSEVFF